MQKRPWEISDLVALRDGEIRDADVDLDDPAAQAQLRKIRQIQAELNALPDVPVDEAIWNRPAVAKTSRSSWLRFPLATAASVFFASFVGIYLIFGAVDLEQEPTGSAGGAAQYATGDQRSVAVSSRLPILMSQSRDLERRLQGVDAWMLSDASSVVPRPADRQRVTSPTERRLMYRLADVDNQIAQLYDADVMDVREREVLWMQRVSLLRSLVAVRGGSDPRIFENSRSM